MMYVDSKKVTLTINIISMVIGIIIACLGIWCYEDFIEFLCIALGIGLVFANGIYIGLTLYTTKVTPSEIASIVIAAINIGLGILFIFNHGLAVTIVFGVFLIIFPIVRILLSNDKKTQAIREIPYFLVGTLVLFNVADIVFRIAIIVVGALLFVLGLVNIILSNRVIKSAKNDDDVIDVEIKEL